MLFTTGPPRPPPLAQEGPPRGCDIEYQGRQLHFTRPYLEGLASAFRSRAYDQVSFQLADSQNTHTNDPERHRGTIVDMQVADDGLYITLDPTERGERVLTENPYLGVSVRIVESYSRSDGTYFPPPCSTCSARSTRGFPVSGPGSRSRWPTQAPSSST